MTSPSSSSSSPAPSRASLVDVGLGADLAELVRSQRPSILVMQENWVASDFRSLSILSEAEEESSGGSTTELESEVDEEENDVYGGNLYDQEEDEEVAQIEDETPSGSLANYERFGPALRPDSPGPFGPLPFLEEVRSFEFPAVVFGEYMNHTLGPMRVPRNYSLEMDHYLQYYMDCFVWDVDIMDDGVFDCPYRILCKPYTAIAHSESEYVFCYLVGTSKPVCLSLASIADVSSKGISWQRQVESVILQMRDGMSTLPSVTRFIQVNAFFNSD